MFMCLDIYDAPFVRVKFLFAGQGPTISFGFQLSNNWHGRNRSTESKGASSSCNKKQRQRKQLTE